MNIGIIGCGAYAISLSTLFDNLNVNLTMWTKIEKEYHELTEKHTNLNALNYNLNQNIKYTMSLKDLSNNNDILIIVIPAGFIKSTIKELKPFYHNQQIIIASKGMIEDDNMLISEYLEKELLTNKISCLSGPTFAIDMIEKNPIGLTLASNNLDNLNYCKNIFNKIDYLTIDITNDIIGVQLCGILKNIMAIATGILNGMNINSSTKTKFFIDSSNEVKTIVEKLGGNKETFNLYAGIGDFLLTTTNLKSRNYTFGTLIGNNQDYENYKNNTTVEGVENLDGIYNLLKSKQINSKIIDILYEIIYLHKNKNLLLDYLYDKR